MGEQKKRINQNYEQWTVVIQGKDVITRLVFTFSLFIARNKKYELERIFFILIILNDNNDLNFK